MLSAMPSPPHLSSYSLHKSSLPFWGVSPLQAIVCSRPIMWPFMCGNVSLTAFSPSTGTCTSHHVHTSLLLCCTQAKPVAPWKKIEPSLLVRPCPPCKQPVSKSCYGGHQFKSITCSEVVGYSCERLCGRLLKCGNHTCKRNCHVVDAESTTSVSRYSYTTPLCR